MADGKSKTLHGSRGAFSRLRSVIHALARKEKKKLSRARCLRDRLQLSRMLSCIGTILFESLRLTAVLSQRGQRRQRINETRNKTKKTQKRTDRRTRWHKKLSARSRASEEKLTIPAGNVSDTVRCVRTRSQLPAAGLETRRRVYASTETRTSSRGSTHLECGLGICVLMLHTTSQSLIEVRTG